MRNLIITLFKKPKKTWPLDIKDYGALAGGLALFSTVTLATITKFSIWFDEAFSAYLLRFDFWHIATYTSVDVHPPVYYWLLKLWSMLFGTSELALRSMSVFFGAIAILFGYVFVKKYFGRRAAVMSLAFMALTPLFIRYGQEARMYTLVTAITFAATYVLALATETKRRLYWVTYGVLVALGLWTHYFAALIFIAHWVWRAWTVYKKGENVRAFQRAFFSKDWLVAHGIALVLLLPWLPFLVRQLLTVQISGFWIESVTPTTISNFLTNVLYYKEQAEVGPWESLVFIGAVAALFILALKYMGKKKTEQRYLYGLIALTAFVPIILLFILSMPPLRPSFVDRYLIPSSLMLSLLAGVTVAFVSRRFWRYSLALILVGMMTLGIMNVYDLGNYNKNTKSSNDAKKITEAISGTAGAARTPLIADTPWLFYEMVFYETPTRPVYFLDASTEYEFGSLEMLKDNSYGKITDLAAFSSQHPVVWYISRTGEAEHPPDAAWTALESITIDDSVSGTPLYQAVKYDTDK